MTITLQKAPAESLEVLKRTLQDLEPSELEMDLAGGARFVIADPLPVYVLGVDAVLEGDVSTGARRIGWRYLLQGEQGGMTTADLDEDEAGGEAPSFNRLTEGESVARFREALDVVESLSSSADGVYDIRVLEVPGLNMAAIWLEGEAGSKFIPFLDASRLRGEPPQLDDSFEESLKENARRVIGSVADPDAG